MEQPKTKIKPVLNIFKMRVANKAVPFRAHSLAEEPVSCAESPGIPLKGFKEGFNEIYM